MTPDDFPKSAKEFFAYAKKNQAEMVDLKFVDMLGSWQHCSFPDRHLDEGTFKEGLGFDGSSIRGWMGIHESDMMAVPDPATARLDPFFAKPTSASSPTSSIRSPEGFHARPAARRAEGRGAPEAIGHRRHLLHRARAGVLHLRRGPLRAEPAPRLLRDRFGRRRVEHRAHRGAEPRLQAELQGRLLSRSARPTRTTTCAARWSTRCARSGSSSRRTTTRSRRPARAKST